MATIAEVQHVDVNTFTHGSDDYPGIETIEANRVRGKLLGRRKEGELIPSAFELVGTDEGPVTFSIKSRSSAYLVALADLASGTVTYLCRNAGESANRKVTMTGVEYESSGISNTRDAEGMFTLNGKALTLVEAAAV